jgi:hypothetical protein
MKRMICVSDGTTQTWLRGGITTIQLEEDESITVIRIQQRLTIEAMNTIGERNSTSSGEEVPACYSHLVDEAHAF